ncbi:nucleosome assembly [Perkinsus chesapeaki]|uniref:Nucleosome assembly n=1 Tax=Perkinsus chesapeaki TaxID=330153 RepID=A0A7J6LQ66_PERCH|nr:nucleosome assembly [Perkinsus chesapeaki]
MSPSPTPSAEEEDPNLPEEVLSTLQELDDSYTKIQHELERELRAVEKAYEKKLNPMLKARKEVLDTPAEEEEGKTLARGFWRKVLQNCDEFEDDVEEWDVPVLEYLIDITAEDILPPDCDEWTAPRGFSLSFTFANNPYFTNSKLTKYYHYSEGKEYLRQTEIVDIDSDEIDWKPDMDVTVEVVQKKRTQARTVTRERPSFFKYFTSLGPRHPLPEWLGSLEDDSFDDDDDDDDVDKLHMVMMDDWERAEMLKDNIIPHAVRLSPKTRVGFVLRQIMEKVDEVPREQIQQLLANTAWAAAKLEAARMSSDEIDRTELNEKIYRFIEQMGSRHLSTVLWSIASSQNWPTNADTFSRITRSLVAVPRPLHHQELANTLWALARAPEEFRRECRETSITLMTKYSARADPKFRFSDQHSANILWSIAKLGVRPQQAEGVINICISSIQDTIKEYRPHSLSLCAWSLATLGVHSEVVASILEEASARQLQNFENQQVAHLVWAGGTLLSEWTLDGLPERLAATVDKAKPQNVANVLWGIARSGPPLNSKLVRYTQTHLETSARPYLPVDLSSLLWALGTMTNKGDVPDSLDDLVLSIYRKVKAQMTSDWTARHIGSAAWGIATLATNGVGRGEALPLLEDMILLANKAGVDTFSDQEAAGMFMWALAKVEIRPIERVRAILYDFAEHFKSKADASRSNTLSLAAWSVSALRFKDDELLRVAVEKMKSDPAANYADFTAVIHAAAITQSELMPPLLVDELWRTCGVISAPDTQLAICGWSLTAMDLGRGIYSDKINTVSDRLSAIDLNTLNQSARKLARTVLSASNRVINLPRERLDIRSSQAHQSWVGAMRKYGIHGVQSEFEVLPGVFVDIALPADKVAIEVQGETHYLIELSTGQRLDTTGNTKLKRHMVEMKGWTLVEVPAMKYMPTKRDVEKFLKPFLM